MACVTEELNLLFYFDLNLYLNSQMWLLSTVMDTSDLDVMHTHIKKSEDLILIEECPNVMGA